MEENNFEMELLENYLNNYTNPINRKTVFDIIEIFNNLNYQKWEDEVEDLFAILDHLEPTVIELRFINLFKRHSELVLKEFGILINPDLDILELNLIDLYNILFVLDLISELEVGEYYHILDILNSETDNITKLVSLIQDYTSSNTDFMFLIDTVDSELINNMLETFAKRIEIIENSVIEENKHDMEFLNKIIKACKTVPYGVSEILKDDTIDIKQLLNTYLNLNIKDVNTLAIDIFSILKLLEVNDDIETMFDNLLNGIWEDEKFIRIKKKILDLENNFIKENK